MLLLTGASGLVGTALRRACSRPRSPIRCLVRDPRRLGEDRVRVQIALGDLADPPSFRNALRGVDTVVHLAAAVRDQPQGSIEELSGIATWRLVDAARRAGAERFVFFSALGASTQSRARLLRAKALAEEAVRDSGLDTTIFAPSIIYAPGDRYTTLLARLALLPGVMPFSGRGRARVPADLGRRTSPTASMARSPRARRQRPLRARRARRADARADRAARAERSGDAGALLHIPTPIVARALRALERAAGPARVRDLGRARADGGLDASPRAGGERRRAARRATRARWPPCSASADRRAQRARRRGGLERRGEREQLRPPPRDGRRAARRAAGRRRRRRAAARAPAGPSRLKIGRERREGARAAEGAPAARGRRCRASRAAAAAARAPA